MSEVNAHNYMDHFSGEMTHQSGGGKPAGLAQGVELFSAPDDAEFLFHPLPHAESIQTGNMFQRSFAFAARIYNGFLGSNEIAFSPETFNEPDAVQQWLENEAMIPGSDKSLKFIKHDAFTREQVAYKSFRDKVGIKLRVLLYICYSTDNFHSIAPQPELWMIGNQTWSEKIYPQVAHPVLQQSGIVVHDPNAGMWFRCKTSGKGIRKRFVSAQMYGTSPMQLTSSPEYTQAMLSKVLPLEGTLRRLTQQDTLEMLDRARAQFDSIGRQQDAAARTQVAMNQSPFPGPASNQPMTPPQTGYTQPPNVAPNPAYPPAAPSHAVPPNPTGAPTPGMGAPAPGVGSPVQQPAPGNVPGAHSGPPAPPPPLTGGAAPATQQTAGVPMPPRDDQAPGTVPPAQMPVPNQNAHMAPSPTAPSPQFTPSGMPNVGTPITPNQLSGNTPPVSPQGR